MSVMPRRETERALPSGEKIKLDGGLEIQLAVIVGTRQVDASAGRHGYMVPVQTREPGIIIFQSGNYAGHYTLPAEIARQGLVELCKTGYVRGIMEKHK